MFLQFLNNVRETRTNICPSIISALASHSQNVLPLSWKPRIKYRIDYTSTHTRRNLVPVRTSRLLFFVYYQELFTNWIIEEFLVKNIHSQFCVSNFLQLTLLNSYTFISLSLITMRKEWTDHCNEEIKKTLMFKRHMAPKWRWVCAVRGGCCTVTRG